MTKEENTTDREYWRGGQETVDVPNLFPVSQWCQGDGELFEQLCGGFSPKEVWVYKIYKTVTREKKKGVIGEPYKHRNKKQWKCERNNHISEGKYRHASDVRHWCGQRQNKKRLILLLTANGEHTSWYIFMKYFREKKITCWTDTGWEREKKKKKTG